MSFSPAAVSPSEWGARVNYDTWTDQTPKDKWILHYNGPAANVEPTTAAEMRFLRGTEAYHIDSNGWRGIAYNYAIGQSGVLYRLRGENQGGHTKGDYEPDGVSENREGRAVFFMVGGNEQPTAEAFATFKRLYWSDPMPVIGHQNVFEHGTGGTSTACPGPHIMKFIDNREYANVALNDPGQRVGVDDIFLSDWNFAKSKGWVGEYTDPDDVVTKEEMVAFLRRAYNDAVADAAEAAVDATARQVANQALNLAKAQRNRLDDVRDVLQ